MKIIFVGDIMLGRLVNDALKDNKSDYVWGDTLPILKSADLRIGNLECAFTQSNQPWRLTPKIFHFRSDTKNVACLSSADINVVSLANNHVLDFSWPGLVDTLMILKQAQIRGIGAGLNNREAKRTVFLRRAGLNIGLMAFSDNEPAWEATEDKSGINYVPVDLRDKGSTELLQAVRVAKDRADLLIVSAHWGGNWGYEPPVEHIVFARALIDAGADVIYGHSAHVFRGVEIYRNRPILYSTGDFIDDYAVDVQQRNDESFIFFLETDGSSLKQLTLHPVVIENFQAKLAGPRAKTISAKMGSLCQKFQTKTQRTVKPTRLVIPIGASHTFTK